MKKGNQYKIWFFGFLNDDINHVQFENWLQETKEFEFEIPSDHYMDLISFDFKSHDIKTYISKLVDVFFDRQEFENWRTNKFLHVIINNEIEPVSASRKLRKLYIEQEEKIKCPLISIELGLGFESVLDDCPIESEYDSWNKNTLLKRLEKIKYYGEKIKEAAKRELYEIIKTQANK